MRYHLIGQICLNGHKITGDASSPFAKKFCSKCGEATITACPSCKQPIPGDFKGEGVRLGMTNRPASFCAECGNPYPWTERQIQAVRDLADEIVSVDPAEIDRAKEAFISLTSDTPQTTVAVVRVKKMLEKASPAVGGAIRDILVNIATDAVKRAFGWA